MATLTELFTVINDSDLQDKVAAACLIAADIIRTEDAGTANHANRLLWAKDVFSNPRGVATAVTAAVVAANNGATVAQITNANDSSINTAVQNAVDIFATGA